MKIDELRRLLQAAHRENLEKAFVESYKQLRKAQNYFAPNRVIPKNQRPKWRFMVKNFIKELEKIPPDSENFAESVQLMDQLYALICLARNVYLFSTDDPFRSIGWEEKLKTLKQYDRGRYELEENIDELGAVILMLSAALEEWKKGIDYYFKHSKRQNRLKQQMENFC